MLRVLLRAALVALVPWAAKAASPPDPLPVVITTDCGADMDDQWAIAHAALSPRLHTLAVIGNFAPEPHDLRGADTAECAREALAAVGRLAAVPVDEGADVPLRDRATPARNKGVDRLIRLAEGFSPDPRLTALAFGPATAPRPAAAA